MSNSSVIDHKCINCGAVLKFNPHSQDWKCEYCKSVFTKEQIIENEKKRGIEELTPDSVPNKLEQVSGIDVYICPSCGANIVADENTSATFCIYCKNTAILRNKLIGEFNPSKIIPFHTTKEDAEQAFIKFRKNKPLAPASFTNKKNISEIRGIYIPFWLFDYDVMGSLEALVNTITHYSTHIKTDTYRVKLNGNMSFHKIPVDGSLRLDNDIMNSIEPYDYSKLVDFNHSYLSGFFSEKYDVDSNAASYDSTNRVYTSTTIELKKRIDLKYNSINVTKTEHNATIKHCEYVLLPVWLLNIKYKDKIYTFAMNGQTGKMIGNVPIDIKKAMLYSVVIFFTVMLVMSLLWYLMG